MAGSDQHSGCAAWYSNIMPDSMPGAEEQGATTAASLFGVLAKEAVSDDDAVCLCPLICDCLLFTFVI